MNKSYTFAFDTKVGISGVVTIKTDKGFEQAEADCARQLTARYKDRWWITRYGAPIGEVPQGLRAKLKGCVGMPTKDPHVKGKITRPHRTPVRPAGYTIGNYDKVEKYGAYAKPKKAKVARPIL